MRRCTGNLAKEEQFSNRNGEMSLTGVFGITEESMGLKFGCCRIAWLDMEIEQNRSRLFFIKMASHHVHSFVTQLLSFHNLLWTLFPCQHMQISFSGL